MAGLTETQAYVSQWRKVAMPLADDDDPVASANDQAQQIESTIGREQLEALVASGGEDI